MNRSKSEAIRCKGIAEKMISAADYMAARDKLLEAEKFFPSLDNMGSMLAVCNILCASSIRFPGSGVDYYWVLQLRPSANDSDLKFQFQKLVSLLLPIKKKFPGTELALKLIQDSFSMLSDRDRRSKFNVKRVESWDSCGALCFQDEISNKERVTTAQSSCVDKRVLSTSEVSDESNVQDFQREMLVKRARSSGATLMANNIDTYRITTQEASCVSAQMTSEGKGEVNRTACATTQSINANLKVLSQKKLEPHFFNFENNRKNEVFEVGQIWAAHYRSKVPHRYARVDSLTNFELSVTWLKPVPFTPDERRWCEAGFPVACGSFELEPEMSEVKLNGAKTFSQLCSWVHGVTDEQYDVYPKAGEVWALYKDWDLSEWPSNPDSMERCKFKIVEILTDYSKYVGALVACLVSVEGFSNVFERDTDEGNKTTFSISPNNLYMFSHNIPAFRFFGGEIHGVADGMFELDPLALPKFSDNFSSPEEGTSHNLSSLSPPPSNIPTVRSNPNNQSLKLSWSASDFSIGQVWATYSGNDTMPRRYAVINNLISDRQVRVTFLEPHPILDYEIRWEKENLPMVCGVFGIGKAVVNLEMSSFSYLVKCQRSTDHCFYKIYPRKGEIWAMYRFWNKTWNQFNYNNCQYRVVEILSDFSEANGIKIERLVEVKGCMTFFQKHQFDGFELIRTVPKGEMLSFSHRIPAFIVPGIERYGIPENSLHLDPDALPPKLHPSS